MACLSPIAHEVGNKSILRGCNYCILCAKERRKEWQFRLIQEEKKSSSALFLTLTYTQETLPIQTQKTLTKVNKKTGEITEYPEVIRQGKLRQYEKWIKGYKRPKSYHQTVYPHDLRNFMKALRKRQKLVSDESIKAYSVGEYGGQTDRPHYHLLIFNIHPLVIKEVRDQKIWTLGYTHTGTVTPKSIHYVTGYVIGKKHIYKEKQPKFTSISKGIGINYIEDNYEYHRPLDRTYVRKGKLKQKIPYYYQKKLDQIYQRTPAERGERTFLNAEKAQKAKEEIFENYRKNGQKNPYLYHQEVLRNEARRIMKKLKEGKYELIHSSTGKETTIQRI